MVFTHPMIDYDRIEMAGEKYEYKANISYSFIFGDYYFFNSIMGVL